MEKSVRHLQERRKNVILKIPRDILLKYEEDKMKHKQLFALGIVLVLVILLAIACTSAPAKNITITYTSDGKCTMEGPKTIPAGKNTLEMVGNIQDHGNVELAIVQLDPGKTLKDLQDYPSPYDPDWVDIAGYLAAPSDGTSYSRDFEVSQGPIYFACFYETPFTKIGAFGPVEVKP